MSDHQLVISIELFSVVAVYEQAININQGRQQTRHQLQESIRIRMSLFSFGKLLLKYLNK